MSGRSLKVAKDYLEKTKNAFITLGLTQDELATRLNLSRSTISNFLRGEPIYKENFVKLCQTIKLNWQEITGLQAEPSSDANTEDTSSASPPELRDVDIGQGNYNQQVRDYYQITINNPEAQEPAQVAKPEIDLGSVVSQLRQQVSQDIEERCGTMRIFDMSQPIELGKIYTQVNILEKITSSRRKEISELFKSCSLEEFERFNFGAIKEKRIGAETAVSKHSRLFILGKPGAGKTTFLKHLAIQCNRNKFQGDLVPFFVTLKDFAETDDRDLLTYLSEYLNAKDAQILGSILDKGRALILLDGLDEVLEKNSPRVIKEIENLSTRYPANQFILTCRIAAKEYTFGKFTEVEIADFDDGQIADFAKNWFRDKPIKPETFLERLKQEQPIRELVSSPLLLTLLCISFEELGDFPANRKELYEEGIDALLKKWDAKRGIQRDKVYKPLSVAKKEDLLSSNIAWKTFAVGDYFFKQAKAERYISEYIRNLPGANLDDEALQGDSEIVLKNIEAQHGLLVARAKYIYSFSHLTFQEYFTAREIILVRQSRDVALQELVKHIFDPRWREVFLLAVTMSPNAGKLVMRMKQEIDGLLAGDVKFQEYLKWLSAKAQAEKNELTPEDKKQIKDRLGLLVNKDLSVLRSLYLYLYLYLTLNLTRYLTLTRYLPLSLNLFLDLDLTLSLNLTRYFSRYLSRSLEAAKKIDRKLYVVLLELKERLPKGREKPKAWWQANGKAWINDLRQAMITYRNIGHDWQFNQEQQEKLKQYYTANQLLTLCLQQDCYVAPEVRQYIEETLLLPMAEIETFVVPEVG